MGQPKELLNKKRHTGSANVFTVMKSVNKRVRRLAACTMEKQCYPASPVVRAHETAALAQERRHVRV